MQISQINLFLFEKIVVVKIIPFKKIIEIKKLLSFSIFILIQSIFF